MSGDMVADVLVVGAGISGAMTAEALSASGFNVVVVDRRGAAAGATAASTALVQFELDVPLIKLAQKVGEATALRAWRRSHLAVANLAARIDRLGIKCFRTPRPSLYLSGNALDRAGLVQEGEARRAAGFETEILGRNQLLSEYGINRPAALRTEGGFAIDPVRLTKGLLVSAQDNGARLFAPADVVEVECAERWVKVTTQEGWAISCAKVVFATGYEFPDFITLGGHQLISTFALATKPQRKNLWPEECLIWEASDPYLYLRTTVDGRAIIGGEDESFMDDAQRDACIEGKTQALLEKAGRILPVLEPTAEYSWASVFGSSADGLPTIGEVPGFPNCWSVLGYGGNGITFSRIAAEIIRTEFSNAADPDADIFRFGRYPSNGP